SSILEVFGFGHLKTSPSWGEVPFLCPKILTAQGLRLLQNAQITEKQPPRAFLIFSGCVLSLDFEGYIKHTAPSKSFSIFPYIQKIIF
ncbi:hypothetical protein, partial [Paenibacillus cookii]|uniref:hypothetical protein n=1 Tax=Paenibacillus cookii TaxID=157839 RepID=UPI001BB3F6E7